jgi:uncharacterized membrane protein
MRRIYDGIWHMYAHPLTNLGPFLLGLLAGHFIVYSENPTTERKKFSLTRTQSKLLFAGGLLMSIATVYGIMPEYWNPDQGDNLYNTAYTAMFRTTFSASIVIMIFGIYFTPERLVPSFYRILMCINYKPMH